MSGLMPYVSDVFDFLKSVPNVVWSGIMGSLITVVGVLLRTSVFLEGIGNNYSMRQLKMH